MDAPTSTSGKLAPAHAGERERGSSTWLGRRTPPSPAFQAFQEAERAVQAALPAPWPGVAPATAWGAFTDWALHVGMSPAKQLELAQLAATLAARWLAVGVLGADGKATLAPLPQDRRFDDPAWRTWPYRAWAQSLLARQQWWETATTAVPGVSRHHEEMVAFAARQWLDMVAPSNSLLTNPVVQRRTAQQGGANLVRGALHALEDAWLEATGQPPAGAERYRVGHEVACTPGRVVARTRLMELLQYAPTTRQVRPEPVLIVPAWIMKYYVLDLEPHNSLVRFLVDRGHTVFAISWKNPDAADRDMGLDDYHRLGVCAALDAIARAVPRRPVHALGYCLGGTLLAASAAVLAHERPGALATLTLLAAQTDFTAPGELSLFIDESQVAWLESQMARRGYLDKHQMRATFQMLRSQDLVWSYRLATHLLGERAPLSALMAWNADGTRLPYRMHSEYLRAMFLDNALAQGEFRLEGKPVHLHALLVPMFVVATVQDHVAPWRSVFKLHQLCDAELTFALTAGGHNVGIVNPPGDARSSYRLRRRGVGDSPMTADEWLRDTPSTPGSWWLPWADWLGQHSGKPARPPGLLPSLADAPGEYVLAK